MKSEIKVEFQNTEALKNFIELSYQVIENSGKIAGNNSFLEISEELEQEFFTLIKGLNNATIKVQNHHIIDGFCRFIIDDTNEKPKIYPISMYCQIDENGKYIFY